MEIVHLDARISNICLHIVGNKIADEGLLFSTLPTELNSEIKNILTSYFVNFSTSGECYQLYHESDLALNEVYTYASKIFDESEQLYEQSVNLAKHLYEQSTHPKIKGGEFYTVYFKDCILDGETLDAVGLFKSENKDTYLKVFCENGSFNLESDKGINIKKLDKGCLIFNKDRENGYVVAVVDNTNKGVEAQYWIDDFLHVRQRKDKYTNTQNFMVLIKDFVTKKIPREFKVSKADQIELLNKSLSFFKEKEIFNINNFTHEVIAQPEVIERFHQYKQEYESQSDIVIDNQFEISKSACKKQQRSYKRVINLDKKIQIVIAGNCQNVEQGEDDRGKFYKVYYKDEE